AGSGNGTVPGDRRAAVLLRSPHPCGHAHPHIIFFHGRGTRIGGSAMTLLIIIFLLVLAIVLAAISLGFRLLQNKRKRQVEDILTPSLGGGVQREEARILMDRAPDDPLTALLKQVDLVNRLKQKIQQAGLPWSPAHLLLAMLFMGAVGAVLGSLLRPLGF